MKIENIKNEFPIFDEKIQNCKYGAIAKRVEKKIAAPRSCIFGRKTCREVFSIFFVTTGRAWRPGRRMDARVALQQCPVEKRENNNTRRRTH